MSKVKFDGEANSIELNRITAKKNYASSMQSHKMGATYMFDALHKYMGKEMYPDLPNEVNGNVAVKQLPVYVFEKIKIEGTSDQYNRKYIGNFTVGADKGDNGYFGLTNEAVKNTAIRLEGTDHIKGVGFNYPWEVNSVKNIRYNADKKALCIVTGTDKTAWSAILEQSYCANKEAADEIEAYLEAEFKPAYDCAYRANPLLVGVDMSLNEINADIEGFKKLKRNDGRPYSYCEFWIDGEYDLYYLNLERNRYEKNGVNLYDELSDAEKLLVDAAETIEEKNQVFINFRINRFKEEAPNYWHINDTSFQLSFLYIIAASDNGEKNMYPYKFTPLADGGRWRFFQDDLDSIKKTDNQGQDTKSYSVELHDFTDETQSAYVFKGEDNAYFQAFEMAFPEKLQKMGYDMLQAMYNISPIGTKTIDKLKGFFDEFFFNRAQNYFTKSAYNNDAEYAYEEAWNNKEYVAAVDINPLAQSLGDHYSAEKAWVEKRLLYLMSKFGFGGYSSYEDSSLGVISVRTQDPQGFTLTPAIDSFPTILGGQAQTSKATRRIKAGEAVQLAPVGGGNTNTYIVGADWLSDIGDLKDLSIDPSSVVVLSVASKRLRRLKVGDENPEEVTSYLATLAVQKCDSMETVDARNLRTLVGTVDLSKCPRLLEALFGGTNTTGVVIAAGSKIEHLQLPDSITAIDLRNTKFLDNFEYGTLANLGFLRLENVPTLNAFAMLKEAYNSEGSQLKDIRLVGWTYNGDATDVDMLANFVNDRDKDGNHHPYNGIDAEGVPTTGNPVLEGELNVDGNVYEEAANIVKQNFPTIKFTPKGYYVSFKDPEVLRVLLHYGAGDGIGITTEQVEKLTTISTWFKSNTTIETFDELEKFIGLTFLGTSTNQNTGGSFYGCSSLKSIKIPSSVKIIRPGVFQGCSNLENIGSDLSHITELGYAAFRDTPNFRGTINLKSLNQTTIPQQAFYNSGVERVESLGSATIIGGTNQLTGGAFYGCTNLKYINLENTTQLSFGALYNCTSLEIEDLNIPNLVTLGVRALEGVKIKKISSLGKITSLPDASYGSYGNFGDRAILEEIVIPESVTSIPYGSFQSYSALKNVSFLSVVSLGESTFRYCTSLTHVDFDKIISIGTYCFQGCNNIPSILRFNNLTGNIGGSAFAGNTVITEIYAPLCTSVGSSAFNGCNKLEYAEFPSVLTITAAAFNRCTKLRIAKFRDVQSFTGDVFYACTGLESVIIDNITPPSLSSNAFAQTNSTFVIYVPDGSVEAYKTASNWSTYADRIKPISEYQG